MFIVNQETGTDSSSKEPFQSSRIITRNRRNATIKAAIKGVVPQPGVTFPYSAFSGFRKVPTAVIRQLAILFCFIFICLFSFFIILIFMFFKRITKNSRWWAKSHINRIDCSSQNERPQKDWGKKFRISHIIKETKLQNNFTIRGGSRKKIAKKIIPRVPINKNV